MTSEPIDTAEVMREHSPRRVYRCGGYDVLCGKCRGVFPCLPYRLAEALAERDRQIARLIEQRDRWAALTQDQETQP